MEIAATSYAPLRAGIEAKADRAAKEFEALFVAQMLAPMFEGTKTSALFGGGEGEDAFKSMLHEEFAKAISAHGGFGVADSVRAEMIRIQAARQPQG